MIRREKMSVERTSKSVLDSPIDAIRKISTYLSVNKFTIDKKNKRENDVSRELTTQPNARLLEP